MCLFQEIVSAILEMGQEALNLTWLCYIVRYQMSGAYRQDYGMVTLLSQYRPNLPMLVKAQSAKFKQEKPK